MAGEQGKAEFGVGQLVQHKLFDYRGVIIDADATFHGTEEWYEEVARSRPPKDEPWYHVLPDEAEHLTYVAQQNLKPDLSGEPIEHPWIEEVFDEFRDGRYISHEAIN